MMESSKNEKILIVQKYRDNVAKWSERFRNPTNADAERIRRWVEVWARRLNMAVNIRVADCLSTVEFRHTLATCSVRSGILNECHRKFAREFHYFQPTIGLEPRFNAITGPMRDLVDSVARSLLSRLSVRRTDLRLDLRRRNAVLMGPLREMSVARFCELDSLYLATKGVLDNDHEGSIEVAPSVSFKRFGESLRYLRAAAQAGLGWLIETKGSLTVVPFPRIRYDRQYRLHSEHEAAIVWIDGVREYWWHGVRTNSQITLRPESLTVQQIMGVRNIELRRVMIERFGLERLIKESSAEVIHSDQDYESKRRLLRINVAGDEPIFAVSVVCPSTQRNYFLRVPPTMRSVEEAIAWTFGLSKDQYRPIVES